MSCSDTFHLTTIKEGLTEAKARTVASKSSHSPVSHSSRETDRGAAMYLACHTGSRRLNLGTYACVARALLTC